MLVAKYKSGSQLFISNGNDEDYVYYYQTEQDKIWAMTHNKDHSVDKHYMSLENATKVRLYCYNYPFMKLVEGKEIKELKEFSIFDHKEEYMKVLKYYAQSLPRENKKWYHIYIAITMFEKGKMSLTKKEKGIAQEIHDKGVNCDQYNHIIDYLDQIEL